MARKIKKPFAQQAADACLGITVILTVFYAIMRIFRLRIDSIFIIMVLGFLLAAAGVVLGIIALLGTRKLGARGIAVKATIGLIINSVILVILIVIFISAFVKGIQLARVNAYKQMGVDAALKYPGWVGYGKYKETRIVSLSINDESKLAHFMNSNCEKEISTIHLSAGVPRFHSAVTLDISRPELFLSDGTKTYALPLAEVLGSMKSNREAMLEKFLGPHKISPDAPFVFGYIFVPLGFDWNKLETVVVDVDGHWVEVRGRMYTVEEKKQLFKHGGLKNLLE